MTCSYGIARGLRSVEKLPDSQDIGIADDRLGVPQLIIAAVAGSQPNRMLAAASTAAISLFNPQNLRFGDIDDAPQGRILICDTNRIPNENRRLHH